MINIPYQEVVNHALSVLESGLGDYTDPDDDGHCARIAVVGGSVSQGFFDVRVMRPSRDSDRGLNAAFRVSLVISPAPAPLEDLLRAD